MAYKWDEMTEEERNALVSWEIFGYNKPAGERFIPYTTDISAAWEVIEKITLTKKSHGGQNQRWHMLMSHNWNGDYIVELHEVLSQEAFYADCRTVPEAICKVALRAVGVEIE